MFQTIIITPLTNALVFFTSFLWGNMGLAIITITLLVKVILYPFAKATVRNQQIMKKIQPKLDEIKKNYTNPTEQSQKIMELYKEHNSNPLSGCLPLIIQIPLIFGLYHVFLTGLAIDPTILYSFITSPENISTSFLGVSLTEKSLIFAVIAGISQYIQLHFSPTTKTPTQDNSDPQTAIMQGMQKNMKYFLPILIVIFSLTLPAALALYWITTNIITLIQEWWIAKNTPQ